MKNRDLTPWILAIMCGMFFYAGLHFYGEGASIVSIPYFLAGSLSGAFALHHFGFR